MIKIETAIRALTANNVEFVIVGGIAVRIHSSAYVTFDLDFCYLRTNENLRRIVTALAPFKPRPRDFPENLPFVFDERTLQNGTNFTFKTKIGDIDLLGEVAGLGNYKEVESESETKHLFGCDVKILSLEGLIKAKRSAGRAKDLLVLPELEALREALTDDDDDD
ncbi:MAG: hypothetical protein M3384_18000 [Acidobacteriota bacterium]|nr:hypothetical protein [Acidobacteriota bacterium]